MPYEQMLQELRLNGYCISDNFLTPQHADDLRDACLNQKTQGEFRPARIGHQHRMQQRADIRGDEICWIDNETCVPALRDYLHKLSEIATYCNQEQHLNIIELEAHFAAYEPGTYYKKHVDRFAHTQHRQLSCVYYLNEEWCPEHAGELILYNDFEETLATVAPVNNRFICFNSCLPHEVLPTHHQRLSIAGWLNTAKL